MPVIEGVGSSDATIAKQREFAAFIRWHLAQSMPFLATTGYAYIDITAGPGWTAEYGVGSPIVMARELMRARLAPANFIAIDSNRQHIEALKARLWNEFGLLGLMLVGDHKELSSLLDLAPRRVGRGLLYSDTTGLPPFKALAEWSQSLKWRRIDMLVNVSCRAIKLGRRLRSSPYHLSEQLDAMNRKHWWISEPRGRGQWVFLYGTNFDVGDVAGFVERRSIRGIQRECRLNHSCSVRRGYNG